MMTVDIQNVSCAQSIPTSQEIKQWVQCVLSHHVPVEVCIRIVDLQEITALNATYRHKDQPTNVLAFKYDLKEDFDEMPLLGDIIVCPAVIEREAQEQQTSLRAHWAHIIIHGLLHLLGYDHITPDEAIQMERYEGQVLEQLGFKNPYFSEKKDG